METTKSLLLPDGSDQVGKIVEGDHTIQSDRENANAPSPKYDNSSPCSVSGWKLLVWKAFLVCFFLGLAVMTLAALCLAVIYGFLILFYGVLLVFAIPFFFALDENYKEYTPLEGQIANMVLYVLVLVALGYVYRWWKYRGGLEQVATHLNAFKRKTRAFWTLLEDVESLQTRVNALSQHTGLPETEMNKKKEMEAEGEMSNNNGNAGDDGNGLKKRLLV